MLLQNQLYAGIVDVTEYGVRGKLGDFEPLIQRTCLPRVQSVLQVEYRALRPRQRSPAFC